MEKRPKNKITKADYKGKKAGHPAMQQESKQTIDGEELEVCCKEQWVLGYDKGVLWLGLKAK